MSYPNPSGQGVGYSISPGSNPNPNSTNINGQQVNPALLNANMSLANFSNTTMNPSTSPPNLSLNPSQLQLLTDFHRRQQQQQQQVQHQQQQQRPTPSLIPDHIRQAMATLDVQDRDTFIKRYFETDEGKQKMQVYQQSQQQHAALRAQQLQQQQSNSSPMRTSSDLPPDDSPRAIHASLLPSTTMPMGNGESSRQAPGTPTPAQPRPSIPITKAFDPSTFTRPIPNTQSSQSLGQGQGTPNNNRYAPSNQSSLPPGERNQPGAAFWHNQNPSNVYTPYRRPTSPEHGRGSSGPSRRREDGMRGTMRSELARLMYASGDVENPDVDTIDYMEDLVVDWLADLCAPPPAVRANPTAPLLTPRLDYNIIRHRLSRPSMRKYLDRFEYMEYKAVDMRSARRVAKGNFEPMDQKDLDRQLEKGFLDGEDAGAGTGTGGGEVDGQVKKKRKYKRQGQAQAAEADDGGGAAGGKEKKKPGPKKGWKRGERKGTAGGSSSAPSVRGASIKPEDS